MRKTFSFQNKVIVLFLLLMLVAFFLTGYIAKTMAEKMILQEKESKLLTLAHILDARLNKDGYTALLAQRNAENVSREEKIKILNEMLKEITDEVASSSPGLGVGYYSKELDAIITYGPSIMYNKNMGISIPEDHPGRIVMQTNEPLVQFGAMVRGDILNAMLPIERHKEVIGYIWANELTTEVSAQMRTMTRNIFIVMVLCFFLIFGLFIFLSKKTVMDMDRIVRGLREMRIDLSKRIPATDGDLDEVVNSINDMAADIGKANQETSRAIAIFETVMSNVDAMIYVCDPATKILVYVNDSLAKLLNRTDLVGKPCYEVLYGNTDICDFCPQKELFDENGNPIMTPIHREVHNNLLKRDFLVTDRLITWHDGRLLHMEVGTDVTARKTQSVVEATNIAQRDFLARMSHEIHTPMSVMLGLTQQALAASPSLEQEDYLKKIQSSANILLDIINDILDFSRIEAGMLTLEKHVFNITEMLENVKDLILPRIDNKYLDFRMTIDDSVPEYAIGDSLRLSQILLNLLGNAARFTLNGFISLHLSAELLQVGVLRLNFVIKDSGIGMSREQQEKLFNAYSHSDTASSIKSGGASLGLPISKALVTMMAGDITVTSKAGVGTEFFFYVELEPLYGSTQLQEEKEILSANTRYDGEKILLVEDNAVSKEQIGDILAELGAIVDIADDGLEAVKAFLQNDYSLILMNVQMPFMDGLETTRRIRASNKQDAATVPIIAMTSSVMLEDRLASKEAGMNGYIAKPIDVNELKTILYQRIKGKKTTR